MPLPGCCPSKGTPRSCSVTADSSLLLWDVMLMESRSMHSCVQLFSCSIVSVRFIYVTEHRSSFFFFLLIFHCTNIPQFVHSMSGYLGWSNFCYCEKASVSILIRVWLRTNTRFYRICSQEWNCWVLGLRLAQKIPPVNFQSGCTN